MKIIATKSTIIISEKDIINVSAAFGYATRYSAVETFDELFKDADVMMYDDKRLSKTQ